MWSVLTHPCRAVSTNVSFRAAELLSPVCPQKVTALKACKAEVMELCATHHCNPILVRLAWHDAGKFDGGRGERGGGGGSELQFSFLCG